MKKRVCKVLSTLFMVLCVTSVLVPVSAYSMTEGTAQDMMDPKFIGTMSISSTLDINDSGTASCSGSVLLRPGYRGELTVVLQRSTNGRDWVEVESWFASGSSKVWIDDSKTVVSGYQYRVLSSADIYSSSGTFVESTNKTSSIVEY